MAVRAWRAACSARRRPRTGGLGAAATRGRYRWRGVPCPPRPRRCAGPLRLRSMVIAVSTPNPRASGHAASNAALVRQRWPFSGWAGDQPVARLMPGAGQADHEAVPAKLDAVGEDRDRHVGRAVGDRLDERARVGRRPPKVRVKEQQVPRTVRRITLVDLGAPPPRPRAWPPPCPGSAATATPSRPRPSRRRTVASVEPSLGDHDGIDAGQRQRGGHGLADPLGLVVRRE